VVASIALFVLPVFNRLEPHAESPDVECTIGVWLAPSSNFAARLVALTLTASRI
jgi:hypothetical protein